MSTPKNNTHSMTGLERRATWSLASVYAVRMLGLFMILPVFAIYAEELQGVTPLLVGWAIGIYGLTQALLQIPLGMLSDRIGRKPVIIGGLLVFVLGSVVAAMADSIHGVILGRALQGSGAIAAAVMALAADLTREENRTKVMAAIGMSIGTSFALALVAGPILQGVVGVRGIFWLTAVLALLAIFIVIAVVPQPVRSMLRRDTQVVKSALKDVLADRQLLRLDVGVFVLHAVLTANFVIIPLLLRDELALDAGQHWMIYLPVLLVSFLIMLPFLIIGERKRHMKAVMLVAIALLAVAELSLVGSTHSIAAMSFSLLAFFAAFNLMEASMPSLLSKQAPADIKGTAMGAFSTSQFLGAFAGGVLGGYLAETLGTNGVFVVGAAAICIWLLIAASMDNPSYLSSYLLNVGQQTADGAQAMVERLRQVKGVSEAVVIPEDGVAYLKVDRNALDEEQLREFSVSTA